MDKFPFGSKIDKVIETAKDGLKYILVSGVMFEELGFKYIGPVDGNNIESLIEVINRAKNIEGPVLIHVKTKKGKGYKYAENNKKYDEESGKVGEYNQKKSRINAILKELDSLI